MEPSLRDQLDQFCRLRGLKISTLLRRLAVQDITRCQPEEIKSTRWKWLGRESRSVNLNFAVLPRLAEAVTVRAGERDLTVTDYIRSLAIHLVQTEWIPQGSNEEGKSGPYILSTPQIEEAEERRELAQAELASGYTMYKGKRIVDFIQTAAEKEGLSISAYQKKLLYQDLEKQLGMNFLEVMLNETEEEWDSSDASLEFLLRDAKRRKEKVKNKGEQTSLSSQTSSMIDEKKKL